MIKEYRFVKLPILSEFMESLIHDRGEEAWISIEVRDASSPESPVEKMDLIVVTLTNDKGPDGAWFFEGAIVTGFPSVCRVVGMFVYPKIWRPDDEPLSLITFCLSS